MCGHLTVGRCFHIPCYALAQRSRLNAPTACDNTAGAQSMCEEWVHNCTLWLVPNHFAAVMEIVGFLFLYGHRCSFPFALGSVGLHDGTLSKTHPRPRP